MLFNTQVWAFDCNRLILILFVNQGGLYRILVEVDATEKNPKMTFTLNGDLGEKYLESIGINYPRYFYPDMFEDYPNLLYISELMQDSNINRHGRKASRDMGINIITSQALMFDHERVLIHDHAATLDV